MKKIDKQRLIFGVFLLVLIVLGEVVLEHFHLPAWPAFMIMIFFFMDHMNVKTVPHMLLGGLLGIVCIILIKYFVTALAPYIGAEIAKLLFICIFVYMIIVFGEIIPMVINNYAFMFFTISALAIKAPDPNPFVWMGVEVVGGGIFIIGIIGILKMMEAFAKKKST